MKHNVIAYLAYGSNLDLGQMDYRCPSSVPVATAVIKDYRLMFKGSKTGAYATIEPAKGYEVPVLVWLCTQRDEDSLDRYEGFPTFYYKKTLPIENVTPLGKEFADVIDAFLEKGEKLDAGMAYIMHEEREFGVPSGHYYNVLDDGYETFGFDRAILQKGLSYTAAMVNKGH